MGCRGLTSSANPYYSPLFCPRIFLSYKALKGIPGGNFYGEEVNIPWAFHGQWNWELVSKCPRRLSLKGISDAQCSPTEMSPVIHSGNQSKMCSQLAFPACLSPFPSPPLLLPGTISWLNYVQQSLVSVPAFLLRLLPPRHPPASLCPLWYSHTRCCSILPVTPWSLMSSFAMLFPPLPGEVLFACPSLSRLWLALWSLPFPKSRYACLSTEGFALVSALVIPHYN